MIKTSANDILDYESCPRKWRIKKSGIKGNKQLYAFYRFSSALHHAARMFVVELEDPIKVFEEYWDRYKSTEYPLIYEPGESWDYLQGLGIRFMKQFPIVYKELGLTYILAENRLSIEMARWKLTGQPDYIGNGKMLYVGLDYKTTPKPISQAWVDNSDQMTVDAMLIQEHFLNEDPVEVIICNFVKETENINILKSIRTVDDVKEYHTKIEWFIKQVKDEYFPKKGLHPFNSPCNWCEVSDHCTKPKTKEDSIVDDINEFSKL